MDGDPKAEFHPNSIHDFKFTMYIYYLKFNIYYFSAFKSPPILWGITSPFGKLYPSRG